MKTPETVTTFAGVDARTETNLPEWYQSRQDVDDVTTFAETIRTLPQATETNVAYENPNIGEWVETSRHNAIVEPDRLSEQAPATKPIPPIRYSRFRRTATR